MTTRDEERCRRLRENDPELSIVSIDFLSNNIARRYGEALQHHCFLEVLNIHADIGFLGGTLVDNEDFHLFLEFIATSQSLKQLNLFYLRDVLTIRRLLSAVARRSSSVEALGLFAMTAPSYSLKNLFNQTQSLKKLTIGLTSVREFNGVSVEHVFVALSRNSSIEELGIWHLDEDDDGSFSFQVL
jgi:hypothetical protein